MSETWTLPMTANEICSMYRQARKKTEQVRILAELNATSRERIVEILTAGGCKVDKRATRYLKNSECGMRNSEWKEDERAVEDAGPYRPGGGSEERADEGIGPCMAGGGSESGLTEEAKEEDSGAPYRPSATSPGGESENMTNPAAEDGGPITVKRLAEELAEIPGEALVLIGDAALKGLAFSRTKNLNTGEEILILVLV